MTAGLTALVLARVALRRSAIWTAGPAGHERASRITCPAGIFWGTGHARGGGEQRKLSWSRRGMNRSCAGSKKLLLQSCCTHGFTAVL